MTTIEPVTVGDSNKWFKRPGGAMAAALIIQGLAAASLVSLLLMGNPDPRYICIIFGAACSISSIIIGSSKHPSAAGWKFVFAGLNIATALAGWFIIRHICVCSIPHITFP